MIEICSAVGWKVEPVNDKLGDLAEISRQSVKCAAWFLLVLNNKMRE